MTLLECLGQSGTLQRPVRLFCHIDDFCQTFQIPTPKLSLPSVKSSRQRALSMTPSEIMTVLVQLSWTKRHLAGLSAPLEPLP